MAKARVTVTCCDCGKSFDKETTKHKRSECDAWEEWVAGQSWQCPQCWGKDKRAAEEARGLVIDVTVIGNLGMLMRDSEHIIRMSFAGDTMPHKDAMKALGYIWDNLEDTKLLGFVSTKFEPKAWQKFVTISEYKDELEKALDMGAKVGQLPTDMDISMAVYAIAEAKKFEEKQRKEYEAEVSKLENPIPPDIWKERIRGHRCNRTVYGYGKTRAVYVDNLKVEISEAEAKELEAYWEKRTEYERKVQDLKYKYRIG